MIYEVPDAAEGLMQGGHPRRLSFVAWKVGAEHSFRGLPLPFEPSSGFSTQACDLVGGKAANVLVATVQSATRMSSAGIVSRN